MEKFFIVGQPNDFKQYKTLEEAINVAKKEAHRVRVKGYDYEFAVFSVLAKTATPVPEIDIITVAN